MDRRVTTPKRATSPAWVPQLHVNRPLVKWLFWAADVKEWLFTFFTLAFKDYFEMYFAFMYYMLHYSIVFERYRSHWLYLHGWLTA